MSQAQPNSSKRGCCFICKEQQYHSDYAKHQRFCLKRFILRESNKGPSDRKQIPDIPDNPKIQQILKQEGLKDKINDYNAEAQEWFDTKVKKKCPHCQKIFPLSELKVHQVYCTEYKMLNNMFSPELQGMSKKMYQMGFKQEKKYFF